jgi:hypothetical protein
MAEASFEAVGSPPASGGDAWTFPGAETRDTRHERKNLQSVWSAIRGNTDPRNKTNGNGKQVPSGAR